MFGKKKILKRNESNRNEILNTLTALQNQCRYPELGAQLSDIKEQVTGQEQTMSPAAIKYDAPILEYLKVAEGDLKNGHRVAEIRVRLVQEKLIDRKKDKDVLGINPLMSKQERKEVVRRQKELIKHYAKNPTLYADVSSEATLYPSNIEREIKKAYLEDTAEQYTAQLEELKEQMIKTKDRSLITKFQLVQAKLAGVQNNLKSLETADLKDTNYQAIANELDVAKELEKERAYTDEDVKVKMEQLENLRKAQASDPLLEQMQKMNGGDGIGSAGGASASIGGAVTGIPEIDAIFAEADREEELKQLKQAEQQLEQHIEHLQQLLEDKELKQKEIAAQSKPLLDQRKGWNASQRTLGDVQLTKLQADFNDNAREAKYIQAQLSVSLEQRRLIRENVAAHNSRNLNAVITGIDYKKLTSDSIELIKKNNEELNDLGTHVATLDGEQGKIETDAVSATPHVDATDNVADDKFAAFESAIAAALS